MAKVSFQASSRVPTPCMKLKGVVYVPHRKTAGYVYPGFRDGDPILTREDMLVAGAKEVFEHMYKFLYVEDKK